MAILIESEKKPTNWFGLVIFILVLLLLAAAVYYLFFVSPPLLEKIILPASLEETRQIKGVRVDVTSVAGDPVFRSLRQHVNPPVLGAVGRPNPFMPF